MADPRLLTPIATVAGLWTAPAAIGYSPFAHLLGIDKRLCKDAQRAGRVGLTFDDGPQRGVTERYLDLLGEHDVTATFFVVGEQAEKCVDIVERMVAEGHDVQSHGMRHVDHMLRSPRSTLRDMQRATNLIEQITGKRPTKFRPPHGVITPATIVASRRQSQKIVLWSQWARDWRKHATATSIADESDHVDAGGILLLHDADHYSHRTWHATFDALPQVLHRLAERNLTPCSLADTADRSEQQQGSDTPKRPS